MKEFKNEMKEFKDEMTGFKNEMTGFKDETVRDRRRMNKQWGDLANRLGTLVEDIVAPNLPRVASDLFGCDKPDLFSIRIVRRFGAETREYDAMVVCDDVVLINETKTRQLEAHIASILGKLKEFAEVYPEYAGKRAVGVLASLYPDDRMVRRATRKGVLVMGMGDETMQVLNRDAIAVPVR